MTGRVQGVPATFDPSFDVLSVSGAMHNERLRVLLLERGIKLEDLAAAIDVDPKTIERWITTGRVPYRTNRYAVAAYLGVDEAEIWPHALTSAQVASAAENEVATFYPHRWAVPRDAWQRLFDKAQHEIGILVYSALFLTDDQGVLRALSRKANAGIRVRILLGDPDSEVVAQHGADEGIDTAMAARIRNSLVLLRPLRALEAVETRLHSTVLYNSIYIADDQALVNCHIYGEPAANAPVLHLRKVPGGTVPVWCGGRFLNRHSAMSDGPPLTVPGVIHGYTRWLAFAPAGNGCRHHRARSVMRRSGRYRPGRFSPAAAGCARAAVRDNASVPMP